ncbi:MAG TPA: TerB family tellurite resistance protein [Burkholderiales bacterium]|nr:TerB family tellurite resistance protein [Burkholderiales bacterium]
MFDRLKRWLLGSSADRDPNLTAEQAVAALLYEIARMDYEVTQADLASASAALRDLFELEQGRADALLREAQSSAKGLTSYFEPISAINAAFTPERKIRLVEHLWRVAHADDDLHENEDHLVRKLADLLYVPHIQTMLARQRARLSVDVPERTR